VTSPDLAIKPYWSIGDLVIISVPAPVQYINGSIGNSIDDGYIGVVIRLHSMRYADKNYLDWLEVNNIHLYGAPHQDLPMTASLEFIYNVYVNSLYKWFRSSELIEVI
jgi:hypothetical protein